MHRTIPIASVLLGLLGPAAPTSSPDVRDPSWPHPVVTAGRLYLREQDHLFVYHLRAR